MEGIMSPVIVEEVPVVSEEEIKKILEDMEFEIRCSCPEGTYTGVCCDGSPIGMPGCP
jgi:hypothetical protein